MDSLLERIEENKLDALYLFINETLRDPNEFEAYFASLISVLPQNWSIQRVEVGHEFLTMCANQNELFYALCDLESLRTLIISDGYVPRKDNDNGGLRTEALMRSLPRARNLTNLDLQRLELRNEEHVDLLVDVFDSLNESLEDIRITGLNVYDCCGGLDRAIDTCVVDMSNLRSLAISAHQSSSSGKQQLITKERLLDLCQNSTTLQDLSLRNMNLDDDSCRTIATALTTNSFLTSLDIRQNEKIGQQGYSAILAALERNHDLWCTVMVDNDSFQAKFNSLIELNQANRGDLVRSPTREKLATFVEHLKDDPTAMWYFLTIHDTILYPFVDFVSWKLRKERQTKQQQQQATKRPAQGALENMITTAVETNKRSRIGEEEDILG